MNRKFSMLKSTAVAVALAASVSGFAHADDSSMSRWSGESYRFFSENKPFVDKAPSAWRQAYPNGLPERQYQAFSDESQVYQLTSPTFDYAASSWHQSHPHGLTEAEMQAMSNEDPVWQSPLQSETGAIASSDSASVTKSVANEPFGVRLARFFRVPQGSSETSSN